MLIGAFWLKAMTPKGLSMRPDFERLLNRVFKQLLGARGRAGRSGSPSSIRKLINWRSSK
jgi:hypothetical protein